ncbi:glycosyltransferase family 2 protein [Gellertiella hungarica]|uniref:Glycosyltransferase involved in cell wall biosynthesis n=1 Tax=Gellertiella hungarica TaxID=1572859 RepID=A0A7W6J4I5_9HYPH|nr:glycosyltransferase family 2 protein [Gellertiella hungarica]MBB4064632.1 glycosyltransferase involved in cell wall biosynthesis [Gellertiella hungarica]
MPVLSVVIPFLNESGSAARLADFLRRLEAEIGSRFGLSLETVLVDDGSHDDSIDAYRRHLTGNWKIAELSRNFGKEIALFAGLEQTSGDYVMMIDADLQHPYGVCMQLIEELVGNPALDVVYTVRDDRRQESLKKDLGSRLFYWLINFQQRYRVPENAGDFRIMRRRVRDALLTVRDKRRFNKGLYAWTGFRQKGIPYTPDERIGSASRWSRLALIGLSVEGITSFSVIPLRIFSIMGAMTGVFGLLYGLKILLEVLFHGIDVPGYPSLMVAVAVFGGFNLALLGLIGEYLWVGVSEAKNRPLYILRDIHTPDREETRQ